MSYLLPPKLSAKVVDVILGIVSFDHRVTEYLLTQCRSRSWLIPLCSLWLRVRVLVGAKVYGSRVCPSPDSVTRLVATILHEGAVYVDAGAALGQMAMIASVRVGHTGHVYAFEPHPSFFERLEWALRVGGFRNVTLNHFALAEKDGPILFFLHPHARSSSASRTYNPASDLIEIECQALTLDTYFQQQCHSLENAAVDLIKLDVEGFEFPVLRGAKALLYSWHPILILEVRDVEARKRAFGYEINEMMAYLKSMGYSFWVLRQSQLLPIARDSDLLETDEDLICAHPSGRLYQHFCDIFATGLGPGA